MCWTIWRKSHICDLVTRQMYADYVAAHRTIQTKNIQNTATFIQNDVNT